MDAGTISTFAFGAAVLAFLWSLHRDIGALRQGMNRDIGALRQDMNRDMGILRKDLGRDISDLSDRETRVENRVSRVEGMLAGAGLKVVPDPASG